MPGATRRILRSRAAIRDVVEAADYLAQAASLATADRFVAAVEVTLQQVARAPGIGTRYNPENPAFGELRFAPVRRFKKHLVFHRPIEGGIEVVRVLHRARDLAGVLGGEEEDDDPGDEEGPAEGENAV